MSEFSRKLERKFVLTFLNNIIVNHILILFKKDHFIKNWLGNWEKYKFDKNKSLQENVGYSHIPEIQKYVDISYDKLNEFVTKNISNKSNVLDIGCGTGLYLKLFNNKHNLFGVDLNEEFLSKAKEIVPDGTFYTGNFLNIAFENKFKLIYSFGVFMYIEPSRVNTFFDKIYDLLEPDGIFYLQYSHAVKYKDMFYPDLSYIKHSPQKLERKVRNKFSVIEHKHFFDNRKVSTYDKEHYFFPDGTNKRVDTIRNTYLLILKKEK